MGRTTNRAGSAAGVVSLLLTLLLILVSAGLLGGCFASKETRRGADRLEDLLDTPSWASSVEVGTGRDGMRFKDYVETVVTLRADATIADVAGFVLDLPGQVEEAGLSDSFANRGLRFVAADGGRLELDWRVEPTPDLVTAGATGWFAVAAAYPSVEADLRTDVGDHFRIDLGADNETDAVAATYDALRGLRLASASFDLLSRGSLSPSGAVEVLTRFEAAELPTAEQVARWRQLVAAAAKLPDTLPPSSVRLRLLPGRAVADLVFLTPDDVTAERLTVAAYGDRLWPGIRPFLAGTARLPGPWTVSVSWAPQGRPTSETGLVSLLSDQPPIDNGDASTVWSQQAAAYVAGLG